MTTEQDNKAQTCTNSWPFRTRPHEWWLEKGSSIISPRCFTHICSMV